MVSPTPLRIHLLGSFLVVAQQTPVVALNKPRLQALLALLLLHRSTPQPRRQLAFALWPASDEGQALTNLRNLAYKLRRALPCAERFLALDGSTLQWRPDAPFTLDVAEFEQAIGAAAAATQRLDHAAARAALEVAVACYAGDLLPDCYDEWILPERERLRQLYTAALEQLAALLEEQHEYAPAIRYAQRLLQAEPLHELGYLHLMRLHALAGDRAAALQAYEACARVLGHELGIAPGAPLREAHDRLLTLGVGPAAAELHQASALVGRRREWSWLLARWRGAAEGQLRLAVLSGEAGVGKTRLAEELMRWAGRQGFAVVRAGCYAAEGELAYSPVVTWLRSPAFQPALSRVAPVWLAELARLAPELLGPQAAPARPGHPVEPWRRQRLFDALTRAVLALPQPALLLVDDLQWCDRATLEWLRYLMHSGPGARVLLLGTLRPEELAAAHPLTVLLAVLRAAGQLDELPVDALDAAATAALGAQLAGQPLSDDQAGELYRETEGNPLFVVETMRWRHGGHDPSAPAAPAAHPSDAALLPPRVYAVISARLDRLTPQASALVGLAATIGRAFDLALLGRVSDLSEAERVRGLDELVRRRVIREHGAQHYDFGHDKLREVAYGRMSEAGRRRWHGRIAEALEHLAAGQAGHHWAQVAAHYERAGHGERAARAYRHAAAAARHAFAFAEAVALSERALALLAGAPADGALERDVLECLGDSLALAQQPRRARDAYRRALALTPEEDWRARARLRWLDGNIGRAPDRAEAAADQRAAAPAAGEAPPAPRRRRRSASRPPLGRPRLRRRGDGRGGRGRARRLP